MTDLSQLSREELEELADNLEKLEKSERENKLFTVFPETGPHSRFLYPKHLEFFKATNSYNQVAFVAGNQVGKSFTGATLTTYITTGLYPEWWEGRRFEGPVDVWVIGVTGESVKETIQEKLLGTSLEDFGTGLIPKNLIVKISPRPGIPGAALEVLVRHKSGGLSKITFKSYDQGREKFQGSVKHMIWLDEEPSDPGIYTECLTRTATTDGLLIATFTPLLGLAPVTLSFLPDGMFPEGGKVTKNKFVVGATWDDVPDSQLSKEKKEELVASYLPHEIEARTKGLPSVGSGKIYPILEEDILIEPFQIPGDWELAYGMDTGWKKTAVVWGARDPNTDTLYLFDEYYRGHAEPAVHASAIRSRGEWMRGAIDYAGGVVEEGRRKTTTQQYLEMGLRVYPANKAVEAGILKIYRMLSEGRLKVFKTLSNWVSEYRVYRRDEHGKIVKANDHLMDATRYLVFDFDRYAEIDPESRKKTSTYNDYRDNDASTITGY